jgi:hypothetical protein
MVLDVMVSRMIRDSWRLRHPASSAYPPAVTRPRPSRGRSALVAIFGILACLAITISATTLWVHQIALDTDRYVEVVSGVVTDPEVIDEVSTTLAERISNGIIDRVEVPRVVQPILESWIQEQIASFMGSEAFADGWAAANRAAHSALLRILRSEALLGEEPVTVSVSQLLVIAIERLQDAGIVPDDVELPDPSDREAVQAVREILAERLDIEVPPDFGQITLVRSERLEMARQVVRIFDFVAVASVVVALALLVLTVWLARDRLRAILLLGIGASLALLAAAAGTSAAGGLVAGALAEFGAANTIGALVNALLGNLAAALVVVVAVAGLTTLAIVVIGRQPSPAEAMAVASPYPVPWAPPGGGGASAAPPPESSGGGAIPTSTESAAPSAPPAGPQAPVTGTEPATTPAAKPATKPAAKPAAKPATKPAAKPAAKPRTKPTAKRTPRSKPPTSST